MKIAYILPISWGGIPHYTAELANAVSKYADVIVLKPKDSNNVLFSENVKVINIFDPMYFSRKNIKNVFSLKNAKNFLSFRNIKLTDDINPDIIHFPEIYPQSSIFAFLNRFHRKYPTVSTLHATFESLLSSLSVKDFIHGYGVIMILNRLTKNLIKSDKIIVHTQGNKDILIKKGLNSKRIAVIPHGAYTFFTFFNNYEKDNTDKENCVLFFGYIGENKGIEYLIKAMNIVSREVPDSKVIIAGEGNLSKHSEHIDDESKFEIHNYFIPNEEVAQFFQRAKLVVLPYTYHQGHSGVLATAFPFGKPVIVTNVGEFPNLVDHGKEGLVVPSKDPKLLAEAIIKLLKDEELRKKMGRNALKKAEELSWDNIAKMHMRVYEEVLNEWRKKGNKD